MGGSTTHTRPHSPTKSPLLVWPTFPHLQCGSRLSVELYAVLSCNYDVRHPPCTLHLPLPWRGHHLTGRMPAGGRWSTNPCAHLSGRPVEEMDQRLRVHAEESFRLEALGGTIGWDCPHGHCKALGVNSSRTERRAHGERQGGVRVVIEVRPKDRHLTHACMHVHCMQCGRAGSSRCVYTTRWAPGTYMYAACWIRID